MGGAQDQGGLGSPDAAPAAPADTDDIGQMEAAFSRGDFREAARLARLIVAKPNLTPGVTPSVTEDMHKRANFVLRAIRPDPVALGILTACVFLFAAIIWRTFF